MLNNKTIMIRSERNDDSPDQMSQSDRLYHFLITLLWCLPVAMTLLSGEVQTILFTAVVASAISGILILFMPRIALVALPFFTILSPVAGFFEIFDVSLLFSDLLFVMLAAQFAVLYLKKQKFSDNNSFTSLLVFAILFFVSVAVGVFTGTLPSFKPIFFLLQLIIIFFYTSTFAKSEKYWSLVINSWLVATFLGSLLLINAFTMGIPLINFKDGIDDIALVRQNFNYLFQGSYYYAGFHYMLGISFIILLLKLLFSISNLIKFYLFMILAIISMALLINMNKTALFSIVTSTSIVVLLFPRYSVWNRKTLNNILVVGTFLLLIIVFMLTGIIEYIGNFQVDLWKQRLLSSSSLIVRFDVYIHALTTWVSSPQQVLIGMGPYFLEGGNVDISDAFKFSSKIGLFEGTVDSGWVSYLIELGIINFTVLVSFFVMSIRAVLKHLKQRHSTKIIDATSLYVLGGLLYIAVALSTQMLGYTKTTWWPFQLLIIGLMHHNRLRTTNEKNTLSTGRFESLIGSNLK